VDEHEPSADIAPLAGFLGTWRGRGRGVYPTIADFDYEEETRFWHVGQPWVQYAERTWIPAAGEHSHSESGFWRAHPGGGVDAMLAHPLGLVEVAEGLLRDGVVELGSTVVSRAPVGAAPVASVTRRYELAGDVLTYELRMATDATPLALHLEGRLERLQTG
jgi:hypothetical protein